MATIRTCKGILKFQPQTVYMGIKQIDKTIAFHNLEIVADVLSHSNLNWGPVYGTLLGIIRENDFITWDEDIDLYILEEQKEAFLPYLFEFQKRGFEIIRYWRSGIVSIKKNGEYIDFYFLKDLGCGVRCAVGHAFSFEKYYTDCISWNFRGIVMNIPREYEEFLEFQYGNWRQPVKYADYNMNIAKKYSEIIYLFIINHLPDFLYYPLFRWHHQKELKDFKDKCLKKGIDVNALTLDNYNKQNF